MLKKTRSRVALLCLLFLLAECGPKAVLLYPGFIGVWNGAGGGCTYRLSIDDQSDAYWVKNANGTFVSAQGVARIDNNHLHIGTRRLYINQYPAIDSVSNKWTLILDGVPYTR